MSIKEAYNIWSEQYDSNKNFTRDLEGDALRSILGNFRFDTCLEMGCGTGKNTNWLLSKANNVVAVDFSEAMLAKAKEKIGDSKVVFLQANMLDNWIFIIDKVDLVTFSLVLEHVEDLQPVFLKASSSLSFGGYMYVGELHPMKQYMGSKARFETEEGTQVVECFTHHASDFIKAASVAGFKLVVFEEYFDDENREGVPRILAMLFQKVE
jgi:ubiquinone/menaquinone biosynthesis C-methylase UbiE